jgi:seryl-tRNA synthetase
LIIDYDSLSTVIQSETNMAINFENDMQALPLESLQDLSFLAKELLKTEDAINKLEAELSQVKAKWNKLRLTDIPTTMDELGLSSIRLQGGQRISIEEKMYASIPKKNKAKCADWLEGHQLGDLVKIQVIQSFGRGEKAIARRMGQLLQDQGFSPILSEDMNTTSVKAALRELLQEGEDVPLELFGVHIERAASIKIEE